MCVIICIQSESSSACATEIDSFSAAVQSHDQIYENVYPLTVTYKETSAGVGEVEPGGGEGWRANFNANGDYTENVPSST